MLLPSDVWTLVEFGYRWGETFRTLPFDWDSGSKRLKLGNSWTKTAFWLLTSMFLVLLEIIGCWRLFLRWDTVAMQAEPTIRIHSTLAVIANAAFIQYQICFILSYKDVPQVWNTYKVYTEQFQRKYGRLDRRNAPNHRRQWLVNFLKLNIFAIHLTFLLQLAYIAISPNHVAHTDLGLLSEWFRIGTIRWGRVSLEGVVCTMLIGIAWDIVVVSQAYFWLFGMLPLPYILEVVVAELGQESINDEFRFRTRPELRLPGPFYKVSREVVILTSLLQDIASPMLVVLPINLMVAMVLNGVQAIKDENPVNKSVQFFSFVQLAVVFIMLNRLTGSVSGIFARNVRNFTKQSKDPYWTKRVKALQPPSFRVYGMYTLGNRLIINGLQAVLDNIVSLLSI